MKNELCPITIDEIRKLKTINKFYAMKRYEEWRNRQRKEDKRILKNLKTKIYRFKKRVKNEPI